MSEGTGRSARHSPFKWRREVKRVKVLIPATWGIVPQCPYTGMVTSLSVKGCLVQTGVEAALSEKLIFLCLWLEDGRRISLHGRVLYYLRNIGFGMEFQELTEENKAMLTELVEQHAEEDGDTG